MRSDLTDGGRRLARVAAFASLVLLGPYAVLMCAGAAWFTSFPAADPEFRDPPAWTPLFFVVLALAATAILGLGAWVLLRHATPRWARQLAVYVVPASFLVGAAYFVLTSLPDPGVNLGLDIFGIMVGGAFAVAAASSAIALREAAQSE